MGNKAVLTFHVIMAEALEHTGTVCSALCQCEYVPAVLIHQDQSCDSGHRITETIADPHEEWALALSRGRMPISAIL